MSELGAPNVAAVSKKNKKKNKQKQAPKSNEPKNETVDKKSTDKNCKQNQVTDKGDTIKSKKIKKDDTKKDKDDTKKDKDDSFQGSEDDETEDPDGTGGSSEDEDALLEYAVWQTTCWKGMKSAPGTQYMDSKRVWRRWTRIGGLCELTNLPMLSQKPSCYYTATLVPQEHDAPLADDNFLIVIRFVADLLQGRGVHVPMHIFHTFCGLIGNG